MKPGDPNVLLLETVARQLDEELRVCQNHERATGMRRLGGRRK